MAERVFLCLLKRTLSSVRRGNGACHSEIQTTTNSTLWRCVPGSSVPTKANRMSLFLLLSSYIHGSAVRAAARFSGEEPDNIYSRFTNPTVRTFEQRLAALEGGERCVATASGMGAILTTCLGLLKTGGHIVSSRYLGFHGSVVQQHPGPFRSGNHLCAADRSCDLGGGHPSRDAYVVPGDTIQSYH